MSDRHSQDGGRLRRLAVAGAVLAVSVFGVPTAIGVVAASPAGAAVSCGMSFGAPQFQYLPAGLILVQVIPAVPGQ